MHASWVLEDKFSAFQDIVVSGQHRGFETQQKKGSLGNYGQQPGTLNNHYVVATKYFSYVHPENWIVEDEPILTHIFQRGWFNHQLDHYLMILSIGWWTKSLLRKWVEITELPSIYHWLFEELVGFKFSPVGALTWCMAGKHWFSFRPQIVP